MVKRPDTYGDGIAPVLHAGGQGFESLQLHHIYRYKKKAPGATQGSFFFALTAVLTAVFNFGLVLLPLEWPSNSSFP